MPLAYYARSATQEFWTEHWGSHEVEDLIRIARRSPLTSLIETALPRRGPVLEAGCGLGQYVLLLRERGYPALGVDWSLDALRRCHKAAPEVPVGVTDLAALCVKDDALGADLSLGVVEHDPAGPGRILKEAARVLAPGGTLILSVPYLNGVRRLCRPYLVLRQARLREAGGEFYQCAFTRGEVRSLLAAHGFQVLSLPPYGPTHLLRKALKRLARSLVSSPPRGRGMGEGVKGKGGKRGEGAAGALKHVARRVLYTPPVLRLLGHMILAVAVKR